MIKAFRGGATSPRWSNDPSAVQLEACAKHHVQLNLRMPSKGGGVTAVRINISPDSFAALIQAMLKTDEPATLAAIAEVLKGRTLTIKAGRDTEIAIGPPVSQPAASSFDRVVRFDPVQAISQQ